jgi:hypothetical protein
MFAQAARSDGCIGFTPGRASGIEAALSGGLDRWLRP